MVKNLSNMGCDIHLYVEYRRKNETGIFRDFGGRINPGRNYYMFGLLSRGVRSDNKSGVEPKGMPPMNTLAFAALNDNQCYISESEGEGYVTKEQAEGWVARGISEYTDERNVYVTNPDWHSHSWLTTAEYKAVLDTYKNHPDAGKYAEPEYEAVLSCMEKFESMGFDARIVFWFDN